MLCTRGERRYETLSDSCAKVFVLTKRSQENGGSYEEIAVTVEPLELP